MNSNYIIKRIDELCKQKHMTQYELSKRAGMTQSSLSNLMNRGCMPQINTLEKICTGFGITLSQFFNREGGFPDLSEEQLEVLQEWETLSAKEKPVAKKMLKNIKELR